MTTPEHPPQGWSGGDSRDLTAWTLVQAFHHVARLFYATLAPHGLDPHQFGVLICLVERPGASQAAIARQVLTTPQSAGAILRAMQDRGLVDREPPAGRGHPARVSITPAGVALLDDVTPHVLRAVGPSALGLDEEQSVTLNQLLNRVLAHRGSTAAEAPPRV